MHNAAWLRRRSRIIDAEYVKKAPCVVSIAEPEQMRRVKVKGRHLLIVILLALIFSPAFMCPAFASDTVEDRIANALINRTSYAFMISNDYVFAPNVYGSKTIKDSDGSKTAEMTEDEARNSLIDMSSEYIIRIDNGKESLNVSADYLCDLKIEKSDQGISLNISRTKDKNVAMSIVGIIKGNTLFAHQEYINAYYFSSTKSAMGTTLSGDYQVSLVDVANEQIPPQPVKLDFALNTKKRTIKLTWTDPTPSGPAPCYEIFRSFGSSEEFESVANVSDCTSWTDKSSEVKSDLRIFVDYYIISYDGNGTASSASNRISVPVMFWE